MAPPDLAMATSDPTVVEITPESVGAVRRESRILSLSEVLDLPKGTVESRLFRARMKLKDWLVRRWGSQGLDPEAFGL